MKYKVGDRVRIKSLDWYTSNKNKFGEVWTEGLDGESQICFDSNMIPYCGMETVIFSVERYYYVLKGIPYAWTDEMIEGLAEEETKKENIAWMYNGKLIANSNSVVINQPKYNKLSINTEFCDDKVELVISPEFELKQEEDKWFAIKKKKECPKTYKELL